ncbi:discoidin domain-containing protein [Streptomyces caniscabiei]|uniref:Discoidin domain-containing protein n=1 Tax=Streptomyces caniscabiei TaxID=2746961 RepID=A0ABU4MR08_9ACTN|nr:discoidin domain-containing protein [Streptomyces caniscabiei]MBE4738387.1 discoidin domain-containing protein [Streptomyces caniscabiei]MBE4757149.1 discoidin domain-containing protein [Streptomyces caniscabiei]MBE4770197.1 discoidin domain-containing protein [Streptomyces caniscabiei]MBE4785341.1 discoidin domain-containing protein [Streptomyces caniscabiei]MBE4796683.1 discoidin domain-containing protein [Streptomyces caniscabiei]
MSSYGLGRRRFLATAVGVAAAWTQVSGNALAAPRLKQAPRDNSVRVWLTDVSADKWVAGQDDVLFKARKAANPLTIKIDDSVKYQKVHGFGAAMTDSAAWLIDKLSPAERAKLMKKLFDPSKGIGLSLLRSPMGATDFNASGSYSYDDMPAGRTDPTLADFSIQHDVPYIIPALRQALSLNPSLKVMANPWSPPGWMKTSDSMIGGTLKGEYVSALAEYFVKFVQAYDEAGVPISYISPQNEPMGTPTWPGMFLSAYQEAELIKKIGKAFEANGISTKILAWDHNWDVPSYPETIFSDPAASTYTAGTGWHIYSGDPTYQTLVHNDYPSKETFITEATGGVWQDSDQTAFTEALGTWIINGTRNWANGVMLWNIALDPDRGPLNSDTAGIPMLRGLLTIDPADGQVSYNVDYHALAHASRFVRPGARRIYSNTFGEGSIENVAFQNPDGSKVLIAHNSGKAAKTFSVADGTHSFDYTLNAGDAVTFTYSGPARSGSTPAAAKVPDPTHDFAFKSESGPVTVTYDPALRPHQNSIRTGNKLITYSLPIGASVRTTGRALSRTKWTATASAQPDWGRAANAIDGDINTKWSLGHGTTSGDWFQIDLGSPTSFNKIVFDTGVNNSFDYVTKYQIYVSDDGAEWGSAIASGSGGIGKTTVALPTRTAQYIRIVSTAASGFWWAIGDIEVYGAARGTGSIAAPAAVAHGLQSKSWTSKQGAQVTVVFNGTADSKSFKMSTDGSYTYELPGGTSAMFTTKKLSSFPSPTFSDLKPERGVPRSKFTIHGSGFGDSQGLGTVYFGSSYAEIDTWSDTSISAYVPKGLPAGKVTVSVKGATGADAGGSSFDVMDLGPALPRTGWTATASDASQWDAPGNMLDGDSGNRYSSGTGQYDGLWIHVDMGQAQTFNKVVLDVGGSIDDYARSADVYVSEDGTDWIKVSSVTDGQRVQVVSFPTRTARHIKVVNTADVASNWWSIAEFNVYN